MNIRLETIKLQENVVGKFLDIRLDTKNGSKTKQVGLHETKKFFVGQKKKKNHQQSEKVTYLVEENICKSYIW